ncbi:hypothetical protein Cgig2_029456 [Carnegiea gigantea]|uniref:BHLH domain-containing protein n=1 Tax=Carnegiea gigantea TaxID=171969 RepID=A0A9Q1KKC7_9CARY|nr:hypothetical protein Cgig2_029456 [Carnegiea gigantea]
MVCQAASQTRFRALKHENGVAGCATIIVRVIACFQPLCDCQAEYFRHLLKPVTMQNTSIPFAGPCTDAASPNHALPALRYSELLNLMPMQLKQPRGWFYGLPHLRQGLVPNTTLQEKLPHNASLFLGKVPNENCGVGNTPIPAIRQAPKQFLVFDQTDDEGNYSDDDEETSTGHSPSSLTAHEKQDWFDEEDKDEVASSAGPPVKRQKLSDSGCEDPSVTNAANSVYPNGSWEYKDDAESGCAGGRPVGSLPGNKRLRNEKIGETVSILQTIIPGGKGKDAIMVLDEAINYLRTLKSKAEILGLSSV